MGLNETPLANRLHIGIFGRRNAGKSSMINALTGQALAIVSDTPGTTADPVFKAMELHPVGPVVFIDTAGFDDAGALGQLRVDRTRKVIDQTDLAILVLDGQEFSSGLSPDPEMEWAGKLADAKIPVIIAVNKQEALPEEGKKAAAHAAAQVAGILPSETPVIPVSAKTGSGIEDLRGAIADAVPEDYMREKIASDLIDAGGVALLVMPQDIQAPKGRLILPQVQTIRELLDRRCTVVSTTADGLDRALAALSDAPDLIITDSQCFGEVWKKKPEKSLLTSFSILMAASKGDIKIFADGVSAIDDAAVNARDFRVLIAEACTHVPLNEDIGEVKIPRLLKQKFGDRVSITAVRGKDFPAFAELKTYDLIIHCGACMFNRRLVMSRIAAAQEAGVPITNYGIFLAKMAGILDKVSLP